MILADKIIDQRKKNGWSQEELAEQLGVSRQTVSKWEGAQSVPDMGRVVQLSTLFGVSTDYLLKDDMELPEPTAGAQPDAPERSLSMEEANEFLRVKAVNARCVALGVLLCVLSPVCLILLGGAQAYGLLGLSEAQTMGLGLAVLLLMVGGAVALFVTSAVRVSPYAWLEEESVDTLYGVDGMVKERREQYRPSFTLQLTLGIVLCVLSAVPIFLSVMLYGEQEGFAHVLAVALTLALVAVGVWLIVRASTVWGGFQQLLEEGDYTRASKENKRKLAPFNGVYWGLVTAGYLAWSFLSNSWDRTWIVWPVAGVTYGAILGTLKLIRK
ncbi:MAG: helix-turn-helix transcriptional regulator [Oscillospiraceae bacterium]|nr:helix-turn-helix transcriptional regulator [Oscillospiraceae bacterium]